MGLITRPTRLGALGGMVQLADCICVKKIIVLEKVEFADSQTFGNSMFLKRELFGFDQL